MRVGSLLLRDKLNVVSIPLQAPDLNSSRGGRVTNRIEKGILSGREILWFLLSTLNGTILTSSARGGEYPFLWDANRTPVERYKF
jgi:hypothetical protein